MAKKNSAVNEGYNFVFDVQGYEFRRVSAGRIVLRMMERRR